MEENKMRRSAEEETMRRRKKAEVASRQIVRRRIMIAAIAAVVAVILIVLIVLKVTGAFETIPEASEITVSSDGTVVCEEVSDFSDSSYTKSALKSYMKETVKAYTAENGADSVKLDRVRVKGDTAYAKMTYASADDYSALTNYWMFSGTIEEAIGAGYDFSDAFVSVTDGVKGTEVDTLDITSQSSLKVVILKENINVTVDGEILYVSDGCTTLVDADTVTIAQPDGNEDATQLTYIIYEE